MMGKKILALLLCLCMLVPCLASCAGTDGDVGAYITMYLTDDCFDFDPAKAYTDAATRDVVSMMYDTLFVLDDDGKVKKSLVRDYSTKEDAVTGEVTMDITLNEAYWSNGTQISSNDVLYAFQRLVDQENGYSAASLLYDIKNARAIKEGDASIDDLGVQANGVDSFRITFEGKVDFDAFLVNLTSLATAPLLKGYVKKNDDWAKKSSTIVTSGPYKLSKIVYDEDTKAGKVADTNAVQEDGTVKTVRSNTVKKISYFILERNTYYYRDTEKDAIDKTVKNYRLLVDCRMTDEEILDAFKNEKLFYVGNIPLSIRTDEFVKKNAKVSDSLATFTCFLNENAIINGTQLFANVKVRQALSAAIDREAIAAAVVFADAATGLVAPSVFENGKTKSKTDFREKSGELISTNQNLDAAKSLLSESGIRASDYAFSISVAAYDEVNLTIAQMIAKNWESLGFSVSVNPLYAIENNDYFKEVDDTPKDICDDQFAEALSSGNFEVAAFDYTAYTADAFSMLSSFAKQFAGSKLDVTDFSTSTGVTGYDSEEYNNLMEAIYYVPYFASLTEESSDFLGLYETAEEFAAVYNTVKKVYDTYGITPSGNSKDWASQKAQLLREAEKILMTDLPVIPVLFQKTAVLKSDRLSSVFATYYAPAIFSKAKLKNYQDYVPALENFPIVDWDKMN